jgi:molybdenum cofactor cytidylyltransferase
MHGGKRGNPVLWGKQFIAEMQALDGDQGARTLLDAHSEMLSEIAIEDDGVLFDVDTPDKLADVRARV